MTSYITRDCWKKKKLENFQKILKKNMDFGKFSEIDLDLNNWSPEHIKLFQSSLEHKLQVCKKKNIETQFLRNFFLWWKLVMKIMKKCTSKILSFISKMGKIQVFLIWSETPKNMFKQLKQSIFAITNLQKCEKRFLKIFMKFRFFDFRVPRFLRRVLQKLLTWKCK